MKAISGQKLGKALCEIFNLDSSKVRSISITAHADYTAQVDVTFVVYEEEQKKLVNLLKKYALEQNDSTPEITGDDSTQVIDVAKKTETFAHRGCYNCYYDDPPFLVIPQCYKCINFNKRKPIKDKK